jgi:hypothetical protein
MAVKTKIVFIKELGYLFFDDGQQTIRLPKLTFLKAQKDRELAQLLVAQYPNFFIYINDKKRTTEIIQYAYPSF